MLEIGTFELPCFKKATKIFLSLGFLYLLLPLSPGAFGALRVLCLERIRYRAQLVLSDSLFSSLERLLISKTRGLVDLAVSLKNLLWLNLTEIRGLQLLHIEACNLKSASIVTDVLEELRWSDSFNPTLVKLNKGSTSP
ncbi:hypothetical protein E2562_022456 [Oryza meyeriana var. granulata]|uniref:Uncharacterized protein n=1 Tax=Oryza meyeriana var. granulata TaxID=110450 RepID=A0A6G1BN75_9ORYZ|nr:hypothetical protein E2562_022456 [Oryza meyeriana var. granulata]